MRPTSRQTRPPERVRAPQTSTLDGARTRDSGTKRHTSTSAAATTTALTTNSQRHERLSTTRPLATMPTPPPTPSTADTRPIATLWRSRGNSSRMIAKLRGKTAPPTPWMARKTIRAPMFQAKIAPTEPTRNTASAMTIRRTLPCWSPRRPISGVATEPVSR